MHLLPRSLTLLSLLGLIFITGCAGNQRLQHQVSMIHNQVIALTNEVANLSDQQRELDVSLRSIENRQRQITTPTKAQSLRAVAKTTKAVASVTQDGGVTIKDGVYRTPAGFELPVRSIQTALRNAGYYSGNLDGRIGPVTEAAIMRFQEDSGLETDGVVGRNTWSKLQQFA